MIKSILSKIGNQAHYYQHLRPAVLDATFIVSTGRTGTQFFETFFEGMGEQLLAVHEPRPDLFDISIEKHRDKKTSKAIEQAIFAARDPFLRSYCQARVKQYVESNPFASFLLPEIKAVFPKGRFVIITRQATTYMKSALNKSPLDDGAFYFYGEKDKRERMKATDFEGDPYYNAWSDFDRKQKIAWYWNKCNKILMDFAAAHPNITLHLKFEDLFSKEAAIRQQTIEQLLAFMNIQLPPEQLQEQLALMTTKKNQTKALVYEGVEDWTTAEQEQFMALTKEAQTRIYKK